MKPIKILVIQPYLEGAEEGSVVPLTNMHGQAIVFQVPIEEFPDWKPEEAVAKAVEQIVEQAKNGSGDGDITKAVEAALNGGNRQQRRAKAAAKTKPEM